MKAFLIGIFLITATYPFLTQGSPNPPISDLSLEQKVGQLMMVGIDGTGPTEGLSDLIQKMHIGGVVLYPRNIENPEQVLLLTRSIQALNRSVLPILIATDEEGGKVIRFYRDSTSMPGQMAVGATGSPQLAFEVGRLTGMKLRGLGINMNLAPVLDLVVKPEGRVVGIRSFGESPSIVASFGSAYIRGVQSAGVSATAKHFPGHGRTEVDSHKSLPQISSSLESDLIPFEKAIEEGVDVMMTAHVAYPKLDRSKAPATISPIIISALLRKKLGFKGVVITDDLEMGAIEQQYEIGEAAVQAILAGCDIVLLSRSSTKKKRVYEALLKAVRTGRISPRRLEESLARIHSLKTKVSNEVALGEGIDTADLQNQVVTSIAQHSVTLVKNDKYLLPLQLAKKRTLVISPLYEFYRELRRRSPSLFYLELPLRPTIEDNKQMVKYFRSIENKVDQIIIGIINRHHADLVSLLQQMTNKPIVVVSFDSPHYIKQFPQIQAFLCVYHYRTGTAAAAARTIVGETPPQGVLPVSLR